jgi:hypothetical protein
VVLARRFFTYISAFLLFSLSAQVYSAVIAEVDRRSIGFGETLQLIIRSDQRVTSASPETSLLSQDFDILSTSQSTRQSIINGRREFSSEWLYTITPKKEGNVTIPAIELAGQFTQPISINVGPASQGSTDSAVFLTSELDTQKVYVQQQAILTLRVFHSVALGRGASLSEPSIPNAIIKKLNDSEYQTRIDGREYRVFEQKFAIFPQRSGTLDIPPSLLNATIPTRRNGRLLLDPFANNGQMIRLMSEPLSLEVLPQDSRYRGEHWLPAKDLRILDDLNGGSLTLNVGDSLTRTITVIADGLLGAQIPPLAIPAIEGLKFYPDQPVVSDGEGDKIVGSYTQSYAIIATKEGQFTLPEQQLTWWDSQQQKTKIATLPAKTLTVNTSGNVPVTEPNAPATAILPSAEERFEPNNPEIDASVNQTSAEKDSLWWIAIAILASLWLLSSIVAWHFWRRTKESTTAVRPYLDEAPSNPVKAVQKACQTKDPALILSALREWAVFTTGLKDLDKAIAVVGDETLKQQVDTLQRALFKPADKGDIATAIATIETRIKHLHNKGKRQQVSSLQPLYPTNK